MDAFYDWLLANPWSLVAISAVIFVVTLVLVFKRIFNFVITILLLAICLTAGYLLLNPDLAMNFLKDYRAGKLNTESSKAKLKESLDHTIDDIKGKIDSWKEKVPPPAK